MKVFISHSWKDKATADMLTQNLSSMVDVWLDIQNLRPGDSITSSIDRALAEMDLVIVLWSQNSAKSDGVAAEITTALRLKKPVIPCRIDETELDPRIREVLAIEMQDFKVGYGRLLCTVLPLFARDKGMDLGDVLHQAKDFDGVIAYLEEYRNKRGIKGTDKGYWIERVIASCSKAQEKIGRELQRTGKAIETLQKVYDDWNAAGDDPAKLQALLKKMVLNEHLNPTAFRQVRVMIEQHLERIKPELKSAYSASIQLSEKWSTTVTDCRKQDNERLRQAVPTVQFTVFHPQEIRPAHWYSLLTYVHISAAKDAIASDSRKQIKKDLTYRTKSAPATKKIKHGSEVRVIPELPGCCFNPPSQSLLLLEDWHRVVFRMQASPKYPGFDLEKPVSGRVLFYLETILVGEVPIWTLVSDDTTLPVANEHLVPTGTETTDAYNSIFVSYAHTDAKVVERIEKAYKALGMDFLRDVVKLRSGQQWGPVLLEFIEKADIFQLYWSEKAKSSEYVEREWRHALSLNRPGFIRPLFWQKPMPEPPNEISCLHFAFYELEDDSAKLKKNSDDSDTLSTTHSDCRKQISARLRQGFPTAQIDTISDLLCGYILSASSSLEKLEEFAVESPSRAFLATVGFIGDYIENPNDLIPESRYGVWGFLDDAWLIHNSVYRMAEAGIVNICQFELDWPKIAAADRIVLSLLPQPVLQQLSALMMQFLSFLAAEISGYTPQFLSSGSTYDPFRSYDPVEEESQTAIDLVFSRAGSATNIWG